MNRNFEILATKTENLSSFSTDIDVSWVLDAKKPRTPRLFFLNEEGKNIRNSTMRLTRGKTECRVERVYITVSSKKCGNHSSISIELIYNIFFAIFFTKDNIRDKLTPLEVEMRFNLRENTRQTQERVRRATLEPVIDENRGTIERDSINIQKNCGPDNVCIPDLRLDVKSIDTYLLGSKDLLVFDVKVSNYGEDAFEAGFFMSVPEGMNFRKIERVGDSRDTPITCTAPSAQTNHTLKCDIGNPLSSGKSANFKVILLPTTKQGIAPKYDFFVEANSTNAEIEGTDFDNVYKKTVGISVETNLSVKGVSIDEEILYNTTDYVALENATHESEIGPQVVHIYEIRNGGPSTIEEAEVFFLWPYETISGDSLLYLLNQPETTNNIQCETTSFANVRNLELDQSLATKSYLVSQGAVEKSSLSTGTSSFQTTGYSVGGGGGKTQLTDEEIRRLEEEENRESTGDASYIHRQRANQAAQEQGGQYRQSASWTSSGPAITYSSRSNQSKYSPERYDDFDAQQRYQSYHSQQSGAGANVHAAGAFGTGSSGVRKIDDFSSEGNVHQDFAGIRSRGQQAQSSQSAQRAQSSQSASSAGSSSSSSSSGRRRMMSQQDGEPFRPDLITGVSPYESKDIFQAGTLELNTIGRDNVDEEIRRHGNAAHFAATNDRQNAGFAGSAGSSSSGSSASSHGLQGSTRSGSSFASSAGSAGSTGSSGSSSGSSSFHQSSSKSFSTEGGSQSAHKSANSFQGKNI